MTRNTRVDVEVVLEPEGIATLLKSNAVARMVTEAANRIAMATGTKGARAYAYTTDRKAAVVSVPADAQAVDGVLTRAAASMGLQVVAKGGV